MIIDGHHHVVEDAGPIAARMAALGIDRTVLVGVGVGDLGVVTLRDSIVFRSDPLLRTLGMWRARRLVRSRALRASLLGEPRNDAVLRAVRAEPERFDGFAFLNPETPRALEEARRCLDSGLKGLKLALAQYPTDLAGPRMAALCELARERRAPIFLHLGLTAAASDLAPAVNAFRDVPFIVAHAGVQRFEEVMRLGVARDNVFVDTSSYIATESKILRLSRTLGAQKLVFGSDVPVMCHDPADALAKILRLPVSAGARERILGLNLQAILAEVRPP